MNRHMSRRDVVTVGALATFVGSSACRAQAPQRISLLDFIPAAEHVRIAGGRSSFDCAPDLRRAVRQAATSGAVLWVPRGTYFLGPSEKLNHADRFPCFAAVRMVSGMRLHGESGAMLRMLPGFSTDQSPRAMVMFGTSEAIAGIELRGLVLDMHGRANPISPGRADGRYSRLPQAQIFVSGGRGSAAARVDGAIIADTVFRDAGGVSCVVMGQNDDPSAPLGRGWTIDRCRFLDNGMETDDHSSVFAYADDVTTTNCAFANISRFGPTGVNTAYEVHGSRQTIRGCTFTNMMRGIWVANNYTSVTSDTLIADNAFRTGFYGIDFYNDRSSAKGIRNTRIMNNRFWFDDALIASSPRLNFKVAVQVASEFAQQGITITGNSVTKTGHKVTSAFMVVTGGASSARPHDAIEVTDNLGSGLTFGSFLRTTPTAGLGRLTIVRNRWTALLPSKDMAIAAGDVVEHTGTLQPINSLTLGNMVQAGDAAQRLITPIYVNGWVRSLALREINGYGRGVGHLKLGGAARIEAIDHQGS